MMKLPKAAKPKRKVLASLKTKTDPMLNKNSWAAFAAFFCYAVWIHFNFFSFDAITVSEPISTSLSYTTSVYFNGISLIVFAVLHKRYQRHVFGSGTVVAAIFLCTLGTLIAMSTGLLLEQNPFIDIAAGTMSGIGSSMVLMMLAVLVVQKDSYAPTVIFAFLFANAAAVPLAMLPAPVLLIVVIAMPVSAIACAFCARTSSEVPCQTTINHEDVHLVAPLAIRAAVFVFFIYVGISFSTMFARTSGTQPSPLALLCTTLLVTIVLITSCYTEGRKLNIVSVYRTVFLLTLIGIFSVPFFDGNYTIAYGIIAVLTTMVRAFIFLLEYRICVKTGLSPIIVFGIGETLKKIPGIIVRAIVPFLSLEDFYTNPSLYIKIFIVLGLAIVIVYLLVFSEKNLLQLSKDDHTLGIAETIEHSRSHVASCHGLTERETEIFLHLCEGRSAPWIAKELYCVLQLNQSTVPRVVGPVFHA